MGGGEESAPWNYVASNLNCPKRGFKWSTNFVPFSRGMKIYGGKGMCQLFLLSYGGLNFKSTKIEYQNGVQFVHGDMLIFLEVWPKTTKDIKVAHGIVAYVGNPCRG